MSGTRIYANPGLARRANISLGVVIFSFLFGLFEIWRAIEADAEGGSGYLFAALFLGGGVYGLNIVLNGNRDSVLWLEVEDGHATAAVWRPFGERRLAGPLQSLGEFRPYRKQVRRNVTIPVLLADHPGHPRPLEFDVGPGVRYDDRFRELAGEALAGIEQRPAQKA